MFNKFLSQRVLDGVYPPNKKFAAYTILIVSVKYFVYTEKQPGSSFVEPVLSFMARMGERPW